MDNPNETLVSYGSEIKSLGMTDDGAMKFGAWLVLYGDPDNTDTSSMRDYFTKSTDFDIEDGDKTTVYWNHGLDPELKRRKLGTATLHKKDAGVWMEGILKARDEYEQNIQKMIEAGKLGASSGVPAHLVERKSVGTANEIVLWPLGKDASLTHTPAEPRTAAFSLKSLTDFESEIKSPKPATQHEGMAFSEHSETVLDSVEEFHTRFHDWLSLRESSRKSGKLMSCDTYAWLNHHCETMETLATKMREALTTHAPEAVKQAAIDEEILNAEIRLAELNARLNEVLSPIT